MFVKLIAIILILIRIALYAQDFEDHRGIRTNGFLYSTVDGGSSTVVS